MAQVITKGSLVKFRELLDPGDQRKRFVVLDDWGHKVFVERVVPKLRSGEMLPLFVFQKNELELSR
jgi:hypothetical protein